MGAHVCASCKICYWTLSCAHLNLLKIRACQEPIWFQNFVIVLINQKIDMYGFMFDSEIVMPNIYSNIEANISTNVPTLVYYLY